MDFRCEAESEEGGTGREDDEGSEAEGEREGVEGGGKTGDGIEFGEGGIWKGLGP